MADLLTCLCTILQGLRELSQGPNGHLSEKSVQRQSRMKPVTQRACPGRDNVVPPWTALTLVVILADHANKCRLVSTAKEMWRKVSLFQSAGRLAGGLWTLPPIYSHKPWDLEGVRVSFPLCRIRNPERRSWICCWQEISLNELQSHSTKPCSRGDNTRANCTSPLNLALLKLTFQCCWWLHFWTASLNVYIKLIKKQTYVPLISVPSISSLSGASPPVCRKPLLPPPPFL